jgi:ribosomal protein L16 Arg81 hydroxylase
VLDVHAELDELDGRPFVLDRMRGLSRRDFLERYYARNRPVLMEGLTEGWPAHSEWMLERLKERLGHVEVEVQAGRDSDEHYEVRSDEHKQRMRFGDYIDRITQGGPGNDLYLTANNHFFEREETAVLLNDFTIPGEYLDVDAPPGTIFFWFGPGGTITPLHHDVVNVLFVQVHGRKRISLIPSLQTHRVYNNVGVYSEVDAVQPDLEQHPRFADATRLDVVIEPGQALFIPVGWWHHVEALDTSVSLSFTNFVFPNNYEWQHP